ncbi:apolipoprotein D-like [Sphaeramia orbicularis]|uniref:apolipoprotein D-like n=1 Tax=Sphaeramia orbicularis TaxID=375764 RepID=UPI00117DACFC|nr:apolipoprotein D [Sphaeramia orbicularis]
MTALKVVFVLLLAAKTAEGQSFHLGTCPKPSVQEDFNVTKYMGTWYEIEKLPAAFERGECVQATYSRLPDGMVKVYNEELLPDGKINSIEGVAEVKDPSQPAILSVSFFKGLPGSPYWVLSTDYKSYSLVYSCSDYLSLFHIDFAWILARTRVLSEDFVNQLRGKLEAAGVNIKQLTVTNQTDCGVMN